MKGQAGRMAIEVIAHTGDDQLSPRLVDDWRALACDAGLPFSSPDWMLPFWRHVHRPEGAELCLIEVRDGKELLGVGPFYGPASRGILGLADYRLLGAGAGHRTGPVARAGREHAVAVAIAEALGDHRQTPTMLALDAVPADSPWPHTVSEAWPGARPAVVVSRHTQGLTSVMRGDFDEWMGSRSRRFRERLRRRQRQLAERGVTIRRSETRQQLMTDVDALFDLHRQRFAAQDRKSALDSEHCRRGASEAAAAMHEYGATRLWVAEAEGEVIAASLAFRAGERISGWTSGMNPEWAGLSPGFVLTVEVIRDAHEIGARSLCFGSGDYEYKARLADEDEPLVWLSLVMRGPRYPLARGRLLPGKLAPIARRLQAGVLRRSAGALFAPSLLDIPF